MITAQQILEAHDIIHEYNKGVNKFSFILPELSDFRLRRKLLCLSMDDVTYELGITKSTISRIENGKEACYSAVKKLNDFYTQRENN